ncbi:hypothetical protein P154DRAFT_575196 [Amniculicola lignicola CBS 123094]|uniref:Uncharacterized protein n=1 Tax=Amniculicola lignicola CBS 123094 TaxID=1392246 RepID=A0A6A5WKD1_9PLEO|nr:hypothetical protein P154DRAFT_575196 [Amniculicola lignicola CBS 123094]
MNGPITTSMKRNCRYISNICQVGLDDLHDLAEVCPLTERELENSIMRFSQRVNEVQEKADRNEADTVLKDEKQYIRDNVIAPAHGLDIDPRHILDIIGTWVEDREDEDLFMAVSPTRKVLGILALRLRDFQNVWFPDYSQDRDAPDHIVGSEPRNRTGHDLWKACVLGHGLILFPVHDDPQHGSPDAPYPPDSLILGE